METNLSLEKAFMAMAKSKKLWWQITTLEMTFAKLGTLIIIVIDLYYFYELIDNNKI